MYVVSISVENREREIPEVQEILTKYGDNITTRLGVHNLMRNDGNVIIITYMAEDVEDFVEDLNMVEDVSVNYMEA